MPILNPMEMLSSSQELDTSSKQGQRTLVKRNPGSRTMSKQHLLIHRKQLHPRFQGVYLFQGDSSQNPEQRGDFLTPPRIFSVYIFFGPSKRHALFCSLDLELNLTYMKTKDRS